MVCDRARSRRGQGPERILDCNPGQSQFRLEFSVKERTVDTQTFLRTMSGAKELIAGEP